MGYYSDIKLVTTKKGWSKIKQAVAQASPENHHYITTEDNIDTVLDGKYIVFTLHGVKWYEGEQYGFPEVNAFMESMYALLEHNIPYRYMRVGEGDEDVERAENNMWGVEEYKDLPELELVREIEVVY